MRLLAPAFAVVALCLVSRPVPAKGPPTARPAASPPPTAAEAARMYPWPRRRNGYDPLSARLRPPSGYRRIGAPSGTYAHWLRHLPLLAPHTPVRSYRGRVVLSGGSRNLAAVVDLDVGSRDWQQCMDSIIRIRAEFLWSRGWKNRLRFRYSGRRFLSWSQWRRGVRPRKVGRRTVFKKVARPGGSRKNFRRFLNHLFIYTGTVHYVRAGRVKPADLRAGDFFIQPARGRAYGHAVLVVDLARNRQNKTVALLGQGFMPAQDFHILSRGQSPWFPLDTASKGVKTPFWELFSWSELRRMKN